MASLTPPNGDPQQVLEDLERSRSLHNQFLIASLLNECRLRIKGEEYMASQGVTATDPRAEQCRALGAARLETAFDKMKAAADQGFAPAQAAMAMIENPRRKEEDETEQAEWNRTRAHYLELAVRQCSANALILRGMSRLDPHDLHAPNLAAYTDFLTAQLIRESMFIGAPSIALLLEQESARLHEHQREEAQREALTRLQRECGL